MSETVNRVPLLDIPATYPRILKEVEVAMVEVIRSGHFIMGPKVAELEDALAKYCQSRRSAGVSSGTDALILALMAAGVGSGDEVITSAFTFFATAGAIVRVGAKPVYTDIDPVTFNIDPKSAAERVTPRTRAIIPVHLYGQCADMDPLLELGRKHNLAVIEDAAQAIGSEYKGRRAGSMGRFGCFSFFPTKNLGGFGDAGAVTASGDSDHEMLKILRVHGMHPKYFHKYVGGNFRIDTLQAAIILAKLKYLEEWTEKRRANAVEYGKLFAEAGLPGRVVLPKEVFPRHVYNQYVIRVPGKRDALRDFLQKKNIATEVYYPVPLHLQECFAGLGYKNGSLPESERAALEVLALPVYPELTREHLRYVVEGIREFFA